jgi:hypothetical protein
MLYCRRLPFGGRNTHEASAPGAAPVRARASRPAATLQTGRR